MQDIRPGSRVIVGGRVGTVTRVGKLHGAPGVWVLSPTGDPGTRGSYPTFAPDWCLKLAIVGMTVCRQPRGACTCGMVHVPLDELTKLPEVGA